MAGHLLRKKLAACINIIPRIESSYWWKGRIETSREVLMMIKTTAGSYAKLESEIKKRHSYSVPEIIALSIFKGHPEYLRWVKRSVGN